MPHRLAALVLGFAIGAINLAELVLFIDGYLPRQAAVILLWAVLPAPLVACLGVRFLRTRPAAAILCSALAFALAIGLLGAWDVTLGPGSNEPLAGLMVVVAPTAQNALLAIGSIGSMLLDRWRRRKPAGQ